MTVKKTNSALKGYLDRINSKIKFREAMTKVDEITSADYWRDKAATLAKSGINRYRNVSGENKALIGLVLFLLTIGANEGYDYYQEHSAFREFPGMSTLLEQHGLDFEEDCKAVYSDNGKKLGYIIKLPKKTAFSQQEIVTVRMIDREPKFERFKLLNTTSNMLGLSTNKIKTTEDAERHIKSTSGSRSRLSASGRMFARDLFTQRVEKLIRENSVDLEEGLLTQDINTVRGFVAPYNQGMFGNKGYMIVYAQELNQIGHANMVEVKLVPDIDEKQAMELMSEMAKN